MEDIFNHQEAQELITQLINDGIIVVVLSEQYYNFGLGQTSTLSYPEYKRFAINAMKETKMYIDGGVKQKMIHTVDKEVFSFIVDYCNGINQPIKLCIFSKENEFVICDFDKHNVNEKVIEVFEFLEWYSKNVNWNNDVL
jgi:hypothetical protein